MRLSPATPLTAGILLAALTAGPAPAAAQDGLTLGFGVGPEFGPAGIRESCTRATEWVRGLGADLRAGWALLPGMTIETRVGVQSGTDLTCSNVSGFGFDYDLSRFLEPIVRRDVAAPRGLHARVEGRARLAAGSGQSFVTAGAGLLSNGVPYGVGSIGLRTASAHALGMELDVVVYRVAWSERAGHLYASADDPPQVYVEYGSARTVRGWLPEIRFRFFYELGLLR
jgi:hypothetical protein